MGGQSQGCRLRGMAELQRLLCSRQQSLGGHATHPRPASLVLSPRSRPCLCACASSCPCSVEAHIMHAYSQDFYGQPMRLVALGYIR